MKPTLAILAAGMGSRYGGLKQIDPVGDNGESIINFTIYDAIKAGFKKLVLIIRKEHQEAFETNLVAKIRPFIEVEYAYQDLKDVPEGIYISEERIKPLGTTHALLALRNIIKNDPFVICNADDYYGKDAFAKVMSFFSKKQEKHSYCMVGYKLVNTLSDNGSVTRGFCQCENGKLSQIAEVMNIINNNGQAQIENNGHYENVDNNTPVSMNFWGFYPDIFPLLNDLFVKELPAGLANNPLKYEALLPNDIGKLVKEKKCNIAILTSEDNWFGVTYAADKPKVIAKFKALKENNIYPHDLWQK